MKIKRQQHKGLLRFVVLANILIILRWMGKAAIFILNCSVRNLSKKISLTFCKKLLQCLASKFWNKLIMRDFHAYNVCSQAQKYSNVYTQCFFYVSLFVLKLYSTKSNLLMIMEIRGAIKGWQAKGGVAFVKRQNFWAEN